MNEGGGTSRSRSCASASRLLLLGAMLAILLLASALRFHRLGAQSLWYDEGVAYAHSLRSLPELVPLLQRNVHLPAYFALLGWWQDLTGSSEFALRALSALFSIISVAWAYALGARLVHPGAGLAAAALVALNSFSIYYAQEARMYAMLTAIAAASMWLFIGFLQDMNGGASSGRRRAVILGFINALGLYTHVAFALAILTQLALAALQFGASVFGGWRSERSPFLTAQGLLNLPLPFVLTLVLFLPWLPVAIPQLSAQPNLSQPMPLDETLRQTLGYFALGSAFELRAGDLTIFVWFFLLFGLVPPGFRPRVQPKIHLPVAWVLISVLIYLSLGLTDRYLRFLLPAQLAFALWLGCGFWTLWTIQTRVRRLPLTVIPKLAAVLALALYLLSLSGGLDALYHHPDFQRDDVRGLTARIESELRPGDALLVSAAGFGEILDYYYRGDAPVYALPTSADPTDTASEVLNITLTHPRIFAIFYGSEEQDPEGAVERSLNMHSYQASQEWVGDMRFSRYVVAERMEEPQRLDMPFGDIIRLSSYSTSGGTVGRGDYLLVGFFWLATEAPGTRYKVFLQLLDADGALVAQRDSEPGGGAWPTVSWGAGFTYPDFHALPIPGTLPAGEYSLIAGLYDINDPAARLPVGDSSYIELGTIEVSEGG